MKHSPRKASSSSAGREIPGNLRNANVHRRVYNSPPYYKPNKSFSFYYCSSSSGITALGGPQPLPQLSSTVLGPAPYVSDSLRPCSLDLPQMNQNTSTQFSYTSSAFWFTYIRPSAKIQSLHNQRNLLQQHSVQFNIP